MQIYIATRLDHESFVFLIKSASSLSYRMKRYKTARTRTRDRVISVTESIRHWNTRCRSRRVPRRSVRCVHVASEKGRLGATRGGTELHCFSRRGNLLSALFTRVSSFSLHHHCTHQHHHDHRRERHYHRDRLVSSPIAAPRLLLFAGFRRVLRLLDHPRIGPSSNSKRRRATSLWFWLHPLSADN